MRGIQVSQAYPSLPSRQPDFLNKLFCLPHLQGSHMGHQTQHQDSSSAMVGTVTSLQGGAFGPIIASATTSHQRDIRSASVCQGLAFSWQNLGSEAGWRQVECCLPQHLSRTPFLSTLVFLLVRTHLPCPRRENRQQQ